VCIGNTREGPPTPYPTQSRGRPMPPPTPTQPSPSQPLSPTAANTKSEPTASSPHFNRHITRITKSRPSWASWVTATPARPGVEGGGAEALVTGHGRNSEKFFALVSLQYQYQGTAELTFENLFLHPQPPHLRAAVRQECQRCRRGVYRTPLPRPRLQIYL
jgi:hypothetical protein